MVVLWLLPSKYGVRGMYNYSPAFGFTTIAGVMIHNDYEFHWIKKHLWKLLRLTSGCVWWHFPRQVDQEGSEKKNQWINPLMDS